MAIIPDTANDPEFNTVIDSISGLTINSGGILTVSTGKFIVNGASDINGTLTTISYFSQIPFEKTEVLLLQCSPGLVADKCGVLVIVSTSMSVVSLWPSCQGVLTFL